MPRIFYCFILGVFSCLSLEALPICPIKPAGVALGPAKELCNQKPATKASLPTPPMLISKAFIIIDPGHGGHDLGAQTLSKPRYQEKALNLMTAQYLKSFLQQLGYSVLMTREKDLFVSLQKRAVFANERQPALFVSVHYNSASNVEAKGVEVFYYPSKEDRTRLAQSKHLAQSILKEVIKQTKAASRGVKTGNFAVIRETNMPAVLIEGGFITHEAEMQKLQDPTYLKSVALGIAKGIEAYLNKTL